MWYERIVAYGMEALVTLILALIGLAVAYVTHYIRQASKRLQENSEIELVNAAIARLEHLVVVTVTAAEQRVATDLRQAVKDGKVDRDELLAVAESVKEEVLLKLSDETLKVLEETFGDVIGLIEDYIEATVHELKK